MDGIVALAFLVSMTGLCVGLVRPAWVRRLGTRKRVGQIFATLEVASVLLGTACRSVEPRETAGVEPAEPIGGTATEVPASEDAELVREASTDGGRGTPTAEGPRAVGNLGVAPVAAAAAEDGREAPSAADTALCDVEVIVDGDTIKVR